MEERKIDTERRRLARQARRLTVEAFHQRLADAGITRAFVLFENGELTLSHPEPLAPVQAFLELSQDFAHHEAVLIGREEGVPTLFFAFVHDTRRGLAQGGLRFKPYDNLAEVLADGLRLAQGMTRKNALAGLWWGGGKGVIPRTSALDRDEYSTEGTEARLGLFQAYGRFVASAGGVYYTAEDVGTRTSDMNALLARNRFTTCVGTELGGSGNPSPATARGVFRGMQAAWRFLTGSSDLRGVRVSVQGIGNVGGPLIDLLLESGARVWATDIDRAALEELGDRRADVTLVEPEEIFDLDVDVFAPCAIGAQVNGRTIPRLKAKLICGAANNILEEPVADGERLQEKGVLFVPDYLCNRMGITNCADEWQGYLADDVALAAERVYPDTLRVLRHAKALGITPSAAADQLADIAACELHPLIGHRGRRILDHLAASGWHGTGSIDRRSELPPAFLPGADEPPVRLRWERDGRFDGAGPAIASAPITTAGRPDLAALYSALLADVRARAIERIRGERPRRVMGSDPGGLELQTAVEQGLPYGREEIGRPQFSTLCRDHHHRNDAAIRDQLLLLGAGFDPERWIDPMSERGRLVTRRLFFALKDADRLRRRPDPEGGEEILVHLEEAAGLLRRATELAAVRFSDDRWRHEVVERLADLGPWSISRRLWWGHAVPEEGSSQVLSVWFSLAAWSLDALGWPEVAEPEPLEEVFVDPGLLSRWVIPSQLVALAVTGRPAFRHVHVHGALHVGERLLKERPDAGPDDPDEERFVVRSATHPMRRKLGNVVEPAALIRRFGADALRLGCLLCLPSGPREAVTASESNLRRARRTVRRLSSKVAGLAQLGPDSGEPLAGDHWIVGRCAAAAEEAERAYGERRFGDAARALTDAVDDFARYAAVAAGRRERSAERGCIGRATAAAVARLADGFEPLCPFLFESLTAWTQARAEPDSVDDKRWLLELVEAIEGAPKERLAVVGADPENHRWLEANLAELTALTRRRLEIGPPGSATPELVFGAVGLAATASASGPPTLE